MVKWPERAIIAIKKLYEPLQEIDVYVEDVNDEVFYRSLLNYACSERIKIARVFALGGRSAVIAAAQNHDFTQRRALFVIDGDLDWVCGEPPTNLLGVHQHSAYCIENLLICEKAIALILSQEIVITEEDAILKLDFKQWIDSIQQPLLELFAAYGVAHEIKPEVKTVSNGVGRLCTFDKSTNKTYLDAEKVRAAKLEVINDIKECSGEAVVTDAYNRILARLQHLPNPIFGVSGKDFILPLLDFLLHSHDCKIKRRSLRFRLAINGDIDRYAGLNQALRQAAKGFIS